MDVNTLPMYHELSKINSDAPKSVSDRDDNCLFFRPHLGMSCRVSGKIPFMLKRPTFRPRRVDGKVVAVKEGEHRMHLIPRHFPNGGEVSMTLALGLLTDYIAQKRHGLEVKYEFEGIDAPRFPPVAGGKPMELPKSSLEILRSTKMALIEVLGRHNLLEFIVRFAITSQQGLVVLVSSKEDANKLEANLLALVGKKVTIFNTAKPMKMNDINAYAAIRREAVATFIIGTPASVIGSDMAWEEYCGNIIVTDERVLVAKDSSFWFAADDARFPKRLLLCLPSRITCDHKWEVPIFEYAGPFRYIHAGRGILVEPPVRQELKIKWSITGGGKVQTDLEVARLIDGDKARFRDINRLFEYNATLKAAPNAALVFPTHSSVENILSMFSRFQPLVHREAVGKTGPIVCTTQELEDLQTVDIDTIVWAGAREDAVDFHRMLLKKRVNKSPLQLFDLTEYPGGAQKPARRIGQTLQRWAKRRRNRYEALGYRNSNNTEVEYLKIYERIASQMYQSLNEEHH
jgi:hypothetical protein